jgi:hypothetical protein
MRNNANTGTPSQALAARLTDLLPATWAIERKSQPGKDLLIELRAPDGTVTTLAVQSRPRLEAREVDAVLRRTSRQEADALLIWAPYLSRRTQERIVELGANYADATGNLRIVLERPTLFLKTQGSDKDPAPDKRPLASLKGPAAGRVVRALCDLRPPYGVRELAQRSGTPLASVARVLALLTSNTVSTWLAPRGLSALTEQLRGSGFRYALTGSLPASMLAPVAAPRLATLYVESSEVAEALDLAPAEAGANVLLVEPFDDVVFERVLQRDGLVLASPSQVAADLLTSPGRAPAEGHALLEWMRRNQEVWRAWQEPWLPRCNQAKQ